jgi:hypothetical protein
VVGPEVVGEGALLTIVVLELQAADGSIHIKIPLVGLGNFLEIPGNDL